MNLAFFMDVSILVLLAATVFLAAKLTFSLRNFKEARFEMEGLVNRLTSNIDKAEKSIGGMQNTARKVGLELDEIISDAKKLTCELKAMNEGGNALAARLEKLADRNRNLMTQMDSAGGSAPIQYNRIPAARTAQDDLDEDLERGFVLHDRDFDEEYDDDGASHPSGLQSQAERELFDALQGNKTRQGGRK